MYTIEDAFRNSDPVDLTLGNEEDELITLKKYKRSVPKDDTRCYPNIDNTYKYYDDKFIKVNGEEIY